MFRVISIIGFLGIVIAIAFLSRKETNALSTLTSLLRSGKRQDLLYVLAVASFVLLTLSGFLPVLLAGNSVSGALLFIHVIAAPVFAVCIAAVAVLWVRHHRLDKANWQSLLRLTLLQPAPVERHAQTAELGQKLRFWAILLSSASAILSIVLSMYPLFGTYGQTVLLHLHGYSALFLVLAVVAGSYLPMTSRQVDAGKR